MLCNEINSINYLKTIIQKVERKTKQRDTGFLYFLLFALMHTTLHENRSSQASEIVFSFSLHIGEIVTHITVVVVSPLLICSCCSPTMNMRFAAMLCGEYSAHCTSALNDTFWILTMTAPHTNTHTHTQHTPEKRERMERFVSCGESRFWG